MEGTTRELDYLSSCFIKQKKKLCNQDNNVKTMNMSLQCNKFG